MASESDKKFKTDMLKTLKKEITLLGERSGYPDKTVKNLGAAFAYGLMIGTLSELKREWEQR